MPLLISKIEGRGNGIRTAVVNTSDVARALSRPPSYVIKFFGFELGAQTSISEASDRYIVNGAHDAPKLQDLLDVFIAKFVLCSACKNPETDIIVLKDGNLTRDCKACGQRTLIDPRHKLSSFILKNPPSSAKGKKKAATASAHVGGGVSPLTINGTGTEGSGEDGAANGADVSGATNGADGEDGDNSDDELTRRINAEASTLPELDDAADDDDNWAADMSEEAIRARQKEVEKSLAVLNIDDDDEEGADDVRYTDFGEWIECTEDATDVDIYKKACDLGISTKHRTVQVLAQTLFTEEIVKEIPEHAGLLGKLITSKNHEKALLGGIERLIGLQYPDKIKDVPNVLFKLYDHDLVCEEVVTKWGSRASKKYVDKEVSKKVRKAAKPFLEWLEEADSESEEESD
ncbi:translation initiation factor eIF5 [Sugiyamaella lignohabitans]|uniref:Translation initiation factor eIF5 n=1 Tax=Sugiyamaella lignohabitans TaxID=796027 RepID=A0A167D4G6_9ASCO|nr:translation initiation factor eIF5 [Sugiyamaella lignohabitans]ANB12465.1 translation initiation factor eIF5 [Sugiyamaella lignohabitans]